METKTFEKGLKIFRSFPLNLGDVLGWYEVPSKILAVAIFESSPLYIICLYKGTKKDAHAQPPSSSYHIVPGAAPLPSPSPFHMAHRPDQSMAFGPEQSTISYFLQELTSHPPSDAMSLSSDDLPKNGSILLETFNQVADQRDAARRDLSFAMEAIGELKRHISGLNRLLLETQRELASLIPSDSRQQPHVGPVPRGDWIRNTWFSHPWLRCIRDAEKEWRDGNPQQTLIMMFHRLAFDDLDFEEQMMCRLLAAAVFHSSDDNDRSMPIADEVLKYCECYSRKDPIQAGEIAAIAQFIRGKSFMSVGNWTHAYWAFARATCNPKYKAKARRLKAIAAKSLHDEGFIPCIPPTPHLFSYGSEGFAATLRSSMDLSQFPPSPL